MQLQVADRCDDRLSWNDHAIDERNRHILQRYIREAQSSQRCGFRLSPFAAGRSMHVYWESLGGCGFDASGGGDVQTPLSIALDDDFAIPQDHLGNLYAALQE